MPPETALLADPQVAVQPEARICANDDCNNESPKGRFCPPCYRQQRRTEQEEHLACKGKAFCPGFNGQECSWIVDLGPDGEPRQCRRCNALRLIASAQETLAFAREHGHAVGGDLPGKLDEAKQHFAEGKFGKAVGAARAFFVLRAKDLCEHILSKVVEANLGDDARGHYEAALEHFEAGRYFEARSELRPLQDIQRRERELSEALSSNRPKGPPPQYFAKKKAKSQRDRELRSRMRGHNSPPPQGGRRRR